MQHQNPTKLQPIGPFVVGQIVGYIEREAQRQHEEAEHRRWYALHVRSGSEFAVGAEISDNGMTGYVPGRTQRVRVNAHKHRLARYPLYPGYLFAGFDPAGEAWHSIVGIDGVLRLFMMDFQPIEIPEHVIFRIMMIEASERVSGYDDQPPLTTCVGDVVRLVGCGGLTGLFQTVAEVDEAKRAVRVDLNLMRRCVPMWLSEEKFEVV